MLRVVSIAYWALMGLVILGHFYFAQQQWFEWNRIFLKLADVEPGVDAAQVAANTQFLGHSIASYNASIGIGLLLSLLLAKPARTWVQGVVLALIVLTAAVGASGTLTNTILVARLLPAALALTALIFLSLKAPGK